MNQLSILLHSLLNVSYSNTMMNSKKWHGHEGAKHFVDQVAKDPNKCVCWESLSGYRKRKKIIEKTHLLNK